MNEFKVKKKTGFEWGIHADTQEAAMRAVKLLDPICEILSCEWVQ